MSVFEAAAADEPPTGRDAQRVVALLAGIAALAGPRRTRPLAGFLYGVALSRVHGAGRDRVRREFLHLFDERTSVAKRLDVAVVQIGKTQQRVDGLASNVGAFDRDLLARHRAAEDRIDRLEEIVRGQYGGRELAEILRGVGPGSRRLPSAERLGVFYAYPGE